MRLKETQQKWYITDEHLSLSEGILPDEIKNKRWKPINAFWSDLIPNFKAHVRETHAKNDHIWIDELSKLCDTAFTQNYRDMGVRKFYEIKGNARLEMARHIGRQIEKDLFARWKIGTHSLIQLRQLTDAILALLDERQALFAEELTKAPALLAASMARS